MKKIKNVISLDNNASKNIGRPEKFPALMILIKVNNK